MIRRPAVAGSFYPAGTEALRTAIDTMTGGRTPPREPLARALLVPHAGYIYSGRIACETYLSSRLPDRLVILGPNHTGEGSPIAVVAEGVWRTPLGDAVIDATLADAILAANSGARQDDEAHRREHSIEIQIPFLQRLVPEFHFVPICVGTQRLAALLDLGRALADVIRAEGDDILMILSSDMSHYVPAAFAARQDRKALDRLQALDPEGLHRVVHEEDISMCGVAPAIAGLEAARLLGASSVRQIAYGHSGERTGDLSSVVAYAGVAIL